MPKEYAKKIFNLFVNKSDAFSDPTKFKEYFPGLYITNSYGSGRVMNYYATDLEVFYRKQTTVRDTVDTITTVSQVYAASTPEVITNNNLRLTVAESVKQMVNNGEAIVMGPSGYEVNVKFPIQDIINTYSLYRARTFCSHTVSNSAVKSVYASVVFCDNKRSGIFHALDYSIFIQRLDCKHINNSCLYAHLCKRICSFQCF